MGSVIFLFHKIMMKYVLKKIENSNEEEIHKIIEAVINRNKTKNPDWEIIFLSISRNDSEARKRQLHALIAFLEKHEPAF